MDLFIFYCAFSCLFMSGTIVNSYKKLKDVDLFGYICLVLSPITFPFYLGFGFDYLLETNKK
jgi:O-antigen ligase